MKANFFRFVPAVAARRSACLWMCILFLVPALVQAQAKIGYIDSEAIMKKLPEAQDAQKTLDQIVAGWQDDLSKLQTQWQKKFDEYDRRKLIMSDQSRAAAERELMDMEKKINDFRTQKFGPNGDMLVKQTEMMKPIQDKIFKAIQDVATADSYDYVFDKSGQIFLLFVNEKFDLTTKVLAKLSVQQN
jgi:outer membrane protein